LSRRLLYCGSGQLLWQCRRSLACETFPNGLPPIYFSRYGVTALGQVVSSLKQRSLLQGKQYYDVLKIWGQVCETYSKAQLTYTKDRLPAFAGIGEEFSAIIGKTYVAGLWLGDIEQQLLWVTLDGICAERNEPLRAPSWSWLSIDGGIETWDLSDNVLRMTKLVSLEEQSQATELYFGSYTSYKLLLDATISQGTLESLSNNEVESIPREELYTTSNRVRHKLPQRLRFTASDNAFSVVDEDSFWFHFDEAFALEQPINCYLLCLLLLYIDVHAGYMWWLHGLVLVDTSEQLASPQRLARVGRFDARGVTACIIARHRTCSGKGCDLVKFMPGGKLMMDPHRDGTKALFTRAYCSFLDDKETTRILLV
jgi:hypothetical protein